MFTQSSDNQRWAWVYRGGLLLIASLLLCVCLYIFTGVAQANSEKPNVIFIQDKLHLRAISNTPGVDHDTWQYFTSEEKPNCQNSEDYWPTSQRQTLYTDMEGFWFCFKVENDKGQVGYGRHRIYGVGDQAQKENQEKVIVKDKPTQEALQIIITQEGSIIRAELDSPKDKELTWQNVFIEEQDVCNDSAFDGAKGGISLGSEVKDLDHHYNGWQLCFRVTEADCQDYTYDSTIVTGLEEEPEEEPPILEVDIIEETTSDGEEPEHLTGATGHDNDKTKEDDDSASVLFFIVVAAGIVVVIASLSFLIYHLTKDIPSSSIQDQAPSAKPKTVETKETSSKIHLSKLAPTIKKLPTKLASAGRKTKTAVKGRKTPSKLRVKRVIKKKAPPTSSKKKKS